MLSRRMYAPLTAHVRPMLPVELGLNVTLPSATKTAATSTLTDGTIIPL